MKNRRVIPRNIANSLDFWVEGLANMPDLYFCLLSIHDSTRQKSDKKPRSLCSITLRQPLSMPAFISHYMNDLQTHDCFPVSRYLS